MKEEKKQRCLPNKEVQTLFFGGLPLKHTYVANSLNERKAEG